VCARHFGPLADVSGYLRSELPRVSKDEGEWPALVNVLYLEHYNEAEIIRTLADIASERPPETDSCSTNCNLNGYLVVDHLLKYGYHPYVYELAQHVRRAYMTRDEPFERLTSLRVTSESLKRISAARSGCSPTTSAYSSRIAGLTHASISFRRASSKMSG
jgi:hypothetical protein